MLPEHGKIECRVCYQGIKEKVFEPALHWRMVNNPGAWGSSNPEYLVLGFSKGFTQANLFEQERFEDVAFAKMRNRLTKALHVVDVLEHDCCVDSKIEDPHSNIAFSSLIRCSVSKAEIKNGLNCGYSCIGPVINRAFQEIPQIIENCTDRYLRDLPKSIRAVILLGNSDAYLKSIRTVLKRLFSDTFKQINDVSIQADGFLWVHVSHPSGLNGHFNKWLTSENNSGIKRKQAIEGLSYISNKKD